MEKTNICPICGKKDDPEEYIESAIKRMMIKKKCCFHCAFWYITAQGDPDQEDPSTIVIVNGSHYSFPANQPVFMSPYQWPRAIPTMHYILFENGKVVQTNQLWHQGTIPWYFQNNEPALANNAIFITAAEYDQIWHHKMNDGLPKNLIMCPQPLLNFLLKKYNFTK